jgi:Protein of unknown function (DUF4239)
MNSIVVSLMVFAFVFAGALVGMGLRRALPEEHLGSDAKEVARLATGLIATMAALVLGMLVSSAKGSYDTRRNEVADMSTRVVALDRILANYGPDAQACRTSLRELVASAIDRVWPGEASRQMELRPKESSEDFYSELWTLTPKNDTQAAIRSQAISLADGLRQARWLMFIEAEQTSMSIPLLVVVTAWLAAIFISFGLFTPPNPTVIVTLLVCALAVSSAIFIIMEMYTPFTGVLRISPAPIRDALSQVGK